MTKEQLKALADKNCSMCEGTGEFAVSNYGDDYDMEICFCVQDERAELAGEQAFDLANGN